MQNVYPKVCAIAANLVERWAAHADDGEGNYTR
jgi:hypothetical protein